MSYQSLARKYRPASFSDLVGQSNMVQTLGNAIRLDRIPQAIIFSGVRGVGKTTTARLLAKALNCDAGVSQDSCNECESCKLIASGCHEDVLEIDGASNTGVDDVRELQQTVEYVSQRSKYKIYIIDEVHMLSQSAFNALLKTLEEPPNHVIFVFATTELQKIPETILSRCQTYHLKRISVVDMVRRLEQILEVEKIDFDQGVLGIVAKEGHGSMRDSLTFLDQAIALGNGALTMQLLGSMVSHAASEQYLSLLKALVEKDAAGAFNVMEVWDQSGIEFGSAVEELIKFTRHCFIIKDLGSASLEASTLGLSDADVKALTDIGSSAGLFDLNRIFRTLVKCRLDLNGGMLDRFVAENYLFEWCLDPGLPTINGLSGNSAQVAPKQEPSVPSQHSIVKPKSAPDLRKAFKQSIQTDDAKQDKVSSVKQKPVQKEVSHRVATDSNLKMKFNQVAASTEITVPSIQHKTGELNVSPKNEVAPPVVAQQKWPNSWRDLVDSWKKTKPLQARIIEEAWLIEYSPDKILVAVDPSTMAGGKLLQRNIQLKVREQFELMFGFKGDFAAIPKSEEHSRSLSEENLLEQRNREKSEERASIINDIGQQPVTLEAVSVFGTKVDSIQVYEQR